MHILRIILLLVGLAYLSPVFSQTDPKVVKVDSAMSNPDLKTDSAFLPKKDTTVKVNAIKEVEAKPAVVKDSARLALERLPRQAVTRSAILPGLGQIKNGRWWKVPIIYGGFVSLALAIDFNQRYYKDILNELQYRRANNGARLNPDYEPFEEQALISAKDFYRRNRDLSFLGCGALYAINLIDAYVDAKFFRFDVSDDLAIKVYPSLQPQVSYAYISPVPVIKLKLSL